MSVKLTDLAKKVGLTGPELKKKLAELGFEVKATARTIEDDVAQLVEAELLKKPVVPEVPSESVEELVETPADDQDTVKVYEAFIEKELDKEIIKSQR